MKNVLVLAHDDQGQESRLQCAFDAVHALGGHLYCLDVVNFPVTTSEGAYALSSGFIFTEETEAQEKNQHRLDERLKDEGLTYSWLEDQGDFAESIRRNSDLIDLIVLNTLPYERSGSDIHLPAKLALKQDIPLLVVPEGVMSFDPTGPALVAWDNSPSSNQALQSALPLLKLASDVVLISIAEHRRTADPSEAAAYLSRYGIGTEAKTFKSSNTPVSEQIVAELEAMEATLCVMGAYDHAPLRQRLLGGTTERVMKYATVPLLLAHED